MFVKNFTMLLHQALHFRPRAGSDCTRGMTDFVFLFLIQFFPFFYPFYACTSLHPSLIFFSYSAYFSIPSSFQSFPYPSSPSHKRQIICRELMVTTSPESGKKNQKYIKTGSCVGFSGFLSQNLIKSTIHREGNEMYVSS
jgi:hypothetical protein